MRALCLALTLTAVLHAQSSDARFDVTSVKLNTLPPARRTYALQCAATGQFHSTASNLNSLILWAYDLHVWETSWQVKQDQTTIYDIDAVAGRDVTLAECRVMLQNLLKDRFMLKVHWEKKTIPVHALVRSEKGPAPAPAKETDRVEFVINGSPMRSMGGEMPQGWPMKALADVLGMPMITDRPVVDRTGLAGAYKISLTFEAGFPGTPLPGNDPDIFAALQKMGLKLEKRDEPVDVLFIESFDAPDSN